MWYLYIILATIALYVILCGYVKIKFRFWSIQPVFHIYDFMYWINPPGVINRNLPEMNNYINLLDITTKPLDDINDTTITRMCNFINSYYLRNHDAEYTPEQQNITEYLKNSNYPAYITIYREPKLLFSNGVPEAAIDDFKAVITSRPLHITLKNKLTFPTYYVDNLCVDPAHRKKGIAPRIIQTMIYNVRRLNKKVNTFLFKREGSMTAIVPLTTYITYGYEIPAVDADIMKNERLLHGSMSVIEITTSNLHLFADFIQYNIKKFNCVVLPEISNIATLIKSNNLFIYAIIETGNIIAAYVFRNPSLKYDKEHQSIECIATISCCHHKEIFTTGFNIALQICRKNNNASRLLLENTANSNDIVERYERMNMKIFSKSPTAFFMYNYVCYSIKENKCLFIY